MMTQGLKPWIKVYMRIAKIHMALKTFCQVVSCADTHSRRVICCLSIKHLAYVVVTFYSREKAVKNQEHYSPFSFSSNRCNMKL